MPGVTMHKDAGRKGRLLDVAIEAPGIVYMMRRITALAPEDVSIPFNAYFHTNSLNHFVDADDMLIDSGPTNKGAQA